MGAVAGCLSSSGYIAIKLYGKSYQAHRLAWLFVFGGFPLADIDHINRVRTDNNISNLRSVTRAENQKNKSVYKNNKSGVSGVFWYKYLSKWVVKIKAGGKNKHIGYFLNKDEAVEARRLALLTSGYSVNHGFSLTGVSNG